MSSARSDCRVYWGSHGCRLERGHQGPHECDCCTCLDHAADSLHGSTDPEDEGVSCVAKPPYYGPETRFYGEDATELEKQGARGVSDREAWYAARCHGPGEKPTRLRSQPAGGFATVGGVMAWLEAQGLIGPAVDTGDAVTHAGWGDSFCAVAASRLDPWDLP